MELLQDPLDFLFGFRVCHHFLFLLEYDASLFLLCWYWRENVIWRHMVRKGLSRGYFAEHFSMGMRLLCGLPDLQSSSVVVDARSSCLAVHLDNGLCCENCCCSKIAEQIVSGFAGVQFCGEIAVIEKLNAVVLLEIEFVRLEVQFDCRNGGFGSQGLVQSQFDEVLSRTQMFSARLKMEEHVICFVLDGGVCYRQENLPIDRSYSLK